MATINRRVTASIEGDFVVFLIGMRVNKPWKLTKWLPVFLAMPKMLKELEANPDSGFLGAEQFVNPFKPVLVQYWRSFEDLEKYSRDRDSVHWPAWVSFNKRVASNGDVGIWHETYKISAGQYECIYNNMPETGLGKVASMVDATGPRENAADRISKQ
jgi:Monooxygenase af470-like